MISEDKGFYRSVSAYLIYAMMQHPKMLAKLGFVGLAETLFFVAEVNYLGD